MSEQQDTQKIHQPVLAFKIEENMSQGMLWSLDGGKGEKKFSWKKKHSPS